MCIFYIKLKNKSSNVLLQSILGTYSHLMWVRMEVPELQIVKIVSTPDLFEESKKVVASLQSEIEFDFIDYIENEKNT